MSHGRFVAWTTTVAELRQRPERSHGRVFVASPAQSALVFSYCASRAPAPRLPLLYLVLMKAGSERQTPKLCDICRSSDGRGGTKRRL